MITKIMAKQAANIVRAIKLPDGQHTQTRKNTVKEVFRGYFLDLIQVMDGHGRQNIDISRNIMNRRDWKLDKQVTNLPKN